MDRRTLRIVYFRTSMKTTLLRYFLLFLLSGGSIPFDIFAQGARKIELVNADVSEFDDQVNAKATRLIGNVVFRHENAMMYCDSAWLYRDENKLEAFENVRIQQGDSIRLNGKRLIYEGDTKRAQVFDNVVLTDRKMTLTTTALDYNLQNDIASYSNGATIRDGENTLTSRQGYYYSRLKDLYFKTEVLLVNPRYTITGDSLRYNSVSKIAYFPGPTWIHSRENSLYSEDGWYNTEKQTSSFRRNARLSAKKQTLQGDSLVYNRNTGVGKVFGHVQVHDSINKVSVFGDYGEHHELSDSSWVTGNAWLMQPYEKDTLFLHADTMLSTVSREPEDSTVLYRNLSAFHGVRLYKSDMQGACDSLVYHRRDSTIRMFHNPVLWSGLNQLTADSVIIQTANGSIQSMYLNYNAFICSQADSSNSLPPDSLRFNQIKGKNMTGWFVENKLARIDVSGNGQTIYYTKNKKEKNIGVNRADCSDLVIFINENEVTGITLIKEPDGTLFPIHELPVKELRLKGFKWQDRFRPKSKDDLFN